MEPLRKLSDSDVSKLLRSLEQQKLPDSLHALCFMKQITEWKEKVPEVNCSIYAPAGDFADLTFFLTLVIDTGVFCTYFSASEEGCIRLKNALTATELLKSDTYCILTSIPDRVDNIIGLEWRSRLSGPHQHMQNCHNYIITQQNAASLSAHCPEDVYIRDLTLDDAELINDMWPHHNNISLKLIRGIISSSICLGLCSKENNEMLSWALKWYYGGIGVVQTVDHAKRKGYAQAVVAALIERMVAVSWPIHLVIIDSNEGSIRLFTKMGFQKLNKCRWYYYNVFN